MLARTRSIALVSIALALAAVPACTSTTAPPDAVQTPATVTGPRAAAATAADFDPDRCLDCHPWQGVGDTLPNGGGGSWCASTGSYVDDPSQCPDLALASALERVEPDSTAGPATRIGLFAMLMDQTVTDDLDEPIRRPEPGRVSNPIAVWAAARWLGLPETDTERRLTERAFEQNRSADVERATGQTGRAEPDRASG